MSHFRSGLIGATVVAGLALGVGSAPAFTVGDLTVTTDFTAPVSALAPPTGIESGPEGADIVVGTSGNWKSPFTGTPFAGTASYLAVLNGTFTVTYAALQSSLSFLWGTPDTYNSVAFYRGETLVGTLLGTTLISESGASAGNTTFVNTLVSVFGGFDTVAFLSSQHTFEVGNVAATPVPGPVAAAGLPAALAVLVGFGLWRRRHAA